MTSLRAPLAVAASALASALVPAAAGAAPRPVLQPLIDAPPASTTFQDRVLTGPATARSAQAEGTTTTFTTPSGVRIPVTIAATFTGDPAVAQTYVNFLDTLPHGSELADLKVTIVPRGEVNADCGGTPDTAILACYSKARQRMVVPGDLGATASGVTVSYVITHEYGHHVAAHRSNAPLEAIAFGPKHWASYEMVCDRTIRGLLAPGDQGRNYLSNPGEAWAETYARLVYPAQPWRWNPILKPDAGALGAARADVLKPWTAGVSRTFQGTFTGSGARTRSFRLPLTLDGALALRLRGPAAANYDLRVTSLGKVQARTKAAGSRDKVSYRNACRQARREVLTVTVLRRTGSGPFRLTADYAG